MPACTPQPQPQPHARTPSPGAAAPAHRRSTRPARRSTTPRPGGPAWAAYFSPAHYAGTAARCYRDLDLPKKALTYGPAALTLPSDSSRTHVLHTSLLATIHAAGRELEQACRYGDEAVAHLHTVPSQRVRHRLTELIHHLRPHRKEPIVADFFDRHHALLAAA